MGAVIGVVIGYAIGTRAGEQGWVELKESWKVISSSEEIHDLVASGLSIARGVLGRGSELLAGALNSPATDDKWRSVA
jgi:hypothetical protein